MKDKIVFLIIGILVGAIITTSGFLIYNKTIKDSLNQPEMIQMNENNQMQSPSNGNMGEPPAKPDGEHSEEPPTKPEDANDNVNN